MEESFHTSQPEQELQNFLNSKTVPADNLEEEFINLDAVTAKVKKFLQTETVEPHNKEVFEILMNGEVKSFPLLDAEQVDSSEVTDSILLEVHKKIFRVYNQTDEKKGREFIAAVRGGEVTINGEKFRPKFYRFYYCPCHKQYPFHTKCNVKCGYKEEGGPKCKLKVRKVNSIILLSLHDIFTILFSDPKALNNAKLKNKEFSETY